MRERSATTAMLTPRRPRRRCGPPFRLVSALTLALSRGTMARGRVEAARGNRLGSTQSCAHHHARTSPARRGACEMADDFVPGLEGVIAFETEIAEPDKDGGALR